LRYERRVVYTALIALAPVTVAAVLLAFAGDFSFKARMTTLLFIGVSAFVASYVLHDQLTYPLRTLSNLIAALREEDYSLRSRQAHRDDALGEVFTELNALASMMQSRKLEAVEALALLRAVLAEIDAAIFTFDDTSRLRLVNRAGERLLGRDAVRLIGRRSDEIGIDALIDNSAGRWSVRRTTFREQGVPHQLLVIADIRRELREEELQAWQRIVRVLGHELNNSLTPIMSISTSVERLVTREPLPDDWRDDAVRGMRVIGNRAEALTRFTRAYAQLARWPTPRKCAVNVPDLLRRIAALETRVAVRIADGPLVAVVADPDQLEQLLINVVRNAADASLETGGGVTLHWRVSNTHVAITVEDHGHGLSGTTNLFVPFFTTKPNGTGIGLVLSRQIAEAHGGTLTLEDRQDTHGCIATLTVPL
jgi:two-component system nitrogen regulation sensor histidine kinase NtrY